MIRLLLRGGTRRVLRGRAALGSLIARLWLQARHGGVTWHRGVRLGRGAQIALTDPARLMLETDVTLADDVRLFASGGTLSIGARSFVGIGSVITARERIAIGADCLIAEYVTVRDQDHRVTPGAVTTQNGFDTSPVVIGDNVWIGAKATVTRGVTIGDNAVIGAGAVVTHDIPANAVALGVPARVTRRIEELP